MHVAWQLCSLALAPLRCRPRPFKQEPLPAAAAATGTTIGGAVRTTFAPKIPVRRKAGDAAAAGGGAGAGLTDLITVKEEKKYVPRARLSSTHAPAAAARVAFQPSQPGQSVSGGMASGSGDVADSREVAIVVTHAPTARIPGQETEPVEKKPRVKRDPAAAAAAGSSGATGADGEPSVEMEDVTDDADAEEAELAGMLANESSYDGFLDNGDLVQYRPILLPFPKVRLGVGQGRASTVQRGNINASPYDAAAAARPVSSQSGITSMFDIDEDPETAARAAAASSSAAAAAAVRSASPTRSASPAGASYKVFPSATPARLIGAIDFEEKASETPSNNILFFQFPSHLPFKQAAAWTPPVNPLLSLNGNRQTSLGANTSAISFGASIDMGGTHSGGMQGGSAPPGMSASAAAASGVRGPNALSAPSPSLQALQNISSPMLPPIAGMGMPNLSLGRSANPASAASASAGGYPGAGGPASKRGGPGSIPSSGLMDAVGTSSALGGDEEQDLGDVSKNDPNKPSEAERMAREHKARQARKLLLYSSNFGQTMREAGC